MATPDLTAQRLRELLHYNPETGIFTRPASLRRAAGSVKKDGYRQISVGGKKHYAHRLAWLYMHDEWPDVIDHINGTRDDNRAANLRNVSHSGNNQNVPKYFNGSEGRPMGVTRHQGKWMAQIQHKRQHIYIGVFDSASEASRAYLERKRLLHVEGYSPDMHTSRV